MNGREMGMGYGFWTHDYVHGAALKRWRDFHPDKPCAGAEVVEVGGRRYVRILDDAGKMIGVYLDTGKGRMAGKGKGKYPPDVETAPVIYPPA
jgi:hypothetical protein